MTRESYSARCNLKQLERLKAKWKAIREAEAKKKANAASLCPRPKRIPNVTLADDELSPEQIDKFNDRFRRLEIYKEQYGNCNVPRKYGSDQKLSNWVRGLRQGGIRISPDQKMRLDGLGFVWSFGKPGDNGKCTMTMEEIEQQARKHREAIENGVVSSFVFGCCILSLLFLQLSQQGLI